MTLIDRLSKLEGPDREVDAEIDRAFGLRVDIFPLSGPWTDYPKPDHYRETSRYTASVDAAIALAERVLPKYGRFVRSDMHGHHAGVFTPYTLTAMEGSGATTAIALCIALLRAKEASHGE